MSSPPVEPSPTAPASTTTNVYRPVILRPNEPGAPHFSGENVSEFLEEWDFFCDDYGVSDRIKCTRLPLYCDKKIGDDIKRLDGFVTEDWATFRSSIIGLYWQHDKPKNTMAELNRLIQGSSALDLNVYLLHYASITEVLVAEKALSPLDRVNRLLDGLPEDLRKRVLKFCTKKAWKLSTQDTGTVEPVFEELRKFVFEEAQTRQKEAVYDKERRIREGYVESISSDSGSDTSLSRPTATDSVNPPVSSSSLDPIRNLSYQVSNLANLIRANKSPPHSQLSSAAPTFSPRYTQPCHWCDSPEHARIDCVDLGKNIREGKVRINENNRVALAATGQEFPLMIGEGGMRRILEIASVGSLSVQSQSTKPPDDFDVFTQSLVCVDYGGDGLWKQATVRDICGA
jgi:hypothetical protein